MVKLKSKATKKVKKKDNFEKEDVVVHTSLPPQVEGQLRCNVKLCVNQILWTIPNSPDETHVRVQWWGENSQGAVFRPLDVKRGNKENVNTTARYAIRSGPKQFSAYLNDMGTLVLEVLSGTMQVPVGRAQVEAIRHLSPSKPINGFFEVLSADGEKVAELQVSVILESLMASYDGTLSSVPTPDMSVDFYQNGVENHHVTKPRALVTPTDPPPSQPLYTDDPFKSPQAKQNPSHHSSQGVDRRIHDAYNPLRDSVPSYGSNSHHGNMHPTSSTTNRTESQKALPHHPPPNMGVPGEAPFIPHHNGQTVSGLVGNHYTHPYNPAPSHGFPVSGGHQPFRPNSDSQATLNGLSTLEIQLGSNKSSKEVITPTDNSGGTLPTSDLLSDLLERGNKLKEEMIKSTLKTPSGYLEPGQENGQLNGVISPIKEDHHTGEFFKEILSEEKLKGGQSRNHLLASYDGSVDQNAVDLVMGYDMTSQQYKALKVATGSPGTSISGDGDLQSDLGDPLHDESLLQDLFYKQPSDDSDIDLELYAANSSHNLSKVSSRGGRHLTSTAEFENGIDRSGKGQGERRLRRVLSNGSLASLEDTGNMRPPSRSSRNSSMLSLGYDSEPVKPKSAKKKKTRSRSASLEKKKPKKKGAAPAKRRSRSRSRGGGSQSDSELLMSETSRVSFDPVPSDAEDTKKKAPRRHRGRKGSPGRVDGLSIQRLTLLGRVHLARVVVDKLQLNDDYHITTTPVKAKAKVKGKPPRPIVKKDKCTYFVEYNFPVVATSRDKHAPNAMATEVMRVASKKVKDNDVNFSHRSVFPVLFDADAIDKWWKSALIFKVYSRGPSQKVPRLLGMCSLPLKTVLKSEALYLDQCIEIKDRARSASRDRSRERSRDRSLNSSLRSQDDECVVVGRLKLNIELASDSKDFSTMLAKTRLAEMTDPTVIPVTLQQRPARKISPVSRKHPIKQGLSTTNGETIFTSATQTEPRTANISDLPFPLPPSPRDSNHSSRPPANVEVYQNQINASHQQTHESLTLHMLLMVPEGMNITLQGTSSLKHSDKNPSLPPQPHQGWNGRDHSTRNLYLNCRMFWCDDIARSTVCWGSCDPTFNFVQVAPVLLTGSLLERMRNNYMVIEVWDKKTSSENDQLVGMVKLPLHQLYMSYRDRKIANSLLRSQYPVVSVDGELPVQNPFSGQVFGRLKALLAMGSMEQVASLQNIKMGLQPAVGVPDRPLHYLERQDVYADESRRPAHSLQEHVTEHHFDVSIESISELRLLDNMIWGEADCFIQYHFPAQSQLKQQGVKDIVHAVPSLKPFRTATTLCVPDPVFHDVTRHKLSLPEGTPVQREILTSCAGAGGGGGGIPFEVWCRYYHPNVRDQVIAKATLPLARLCAMVTMQKRGEANVQSFSLPLRSLVTGGEDRGEGEHVRDTGKLEVTITYHSRVLQLETDPGGLARTAPPSTVCISLGVVRGSGLQAAATALARHDGGMQYAAEVGVNTYVRVRLSFLPKEDERITRTVARSFAPDFSYYLDFPCPLLWTEAGSDALSLAEILETAEAVLELWHQVPGMSTEVDREYLASSGAGSGGEVTGRRMVPMSGDILLGTVKIPLLEIIKRKTGINGWYPVFLPSVGWEAGEGDHQSISYGGRGLERVVGGLELSAKFAHHEDLDKVIQAGRGVGWAPDFEVEHRDWESADELSGHQHQVCVSVDTASFPVQNVLQVGQSKLHGPVHCYVRYKLYDRGARCSELSSLKVNEDDYLTTDINHSKTFTVPGGSPFTWYLCEERLEIQVWVTYHAKDGAKTRPHNRDKLIGSAYIDLSPLSNTNRRQHRVSSLYPLFKPGASDLGGAFIRAQISLKAHMSQGKDFDSDSDEAQYPQKTAHNSPYKMSPKKRSPKSIRNLDMGKVFPVHISIERAFHLPIIFEGGESYPPNAYVSYQTAESQELTCTSIFPASSNPLWNHEHETYLDRELLTQTQKNLVFKVWHNAKDQLSSPNKGTDKVLGFVSVDLVPLSTGFQQVCGWYNIMDFNGSCQGQVKVAVTPQENIEGTVTQTTQDGPVESESFAAFLQTTGQLHQPLPHYSQHYSQHYESVKRHHLQLSDTTRGQQAGVNNPADASRSLLFNSLRSNLNDLDTITVKLKERLYVTPLSQTAPGVTSLPSGESTLTSTESQEKFSATDPGFQNELYYQRQENQEEPLNTQTTLPSSGQLMNSHLAIEQDSVAMPQYHRVENDTSTYSQTLRNAQDTLSTAQNLITNLNQATDQLSERFNGHAQSASPQFQAQRPSQGAHVHFTSEAPTILSGELPNTSHSVYTESGLLSEAINGEAVFRAQSSLEDGGEYFQRDWQRPSEEEDEEQDEEASDDQVVMPKPLNDVSSANFANYASLHQDQGGKRGGGGLLEEESHHRGNQSITEEQDSWFSGQHNSSKPELYDTIDEGKDNQTGGDVNDILLKYGMDPNDYAEDDDPVDIYSRQPGDQVAGEGQAQANQAAPGGSGVSKEIEEELQTGEDQSEESGKHVYAFQSLASKYQQPSDHEQEVDLDALLRTNQEAVDDQEALLQEDPTSVKKVSRNGHKDRGEHFRGQKGVRKNAEFRHKYRHHRQTILSSDSEEEDSVESMSQRRKPSPARRREHKAEERLKQGHTTSEQVTKYVTTNHGLPEEPRVDAQNHLPQDSSGVQSPVDRDRSPETPPEPPGQSEDEEVPFGEFNPMMRTQKTIQIVWDDKQHVRRATGVDFDEGSTATYQSSQQESEQGEEEGAGPQGDGQQGAGPQDNGQYTVGRVQTESSQEQIEDLGSTGPTLGLEQVGASSGFLMHQTEFSDTDRSQASARNHNGNNNGHVTQSDVSVLRMSAENSPREPTRAKSSAVPNFFLPAQDMALTMKALKLAATAARSNKPQVDDSTDGEKSLNSSRVSSPRQSVASRLQMAPLALKTRPKPSTEQAQRIAKIFQQKFK